MTAVIDILIIAVLLIGALTGFKRGFIQSLVMFVGALLAIVLAYMFKNPVADFLYSVMPFFSFGGSFEGLSVLNLILYESLAFILVYIVLIILVQILVKVSKIFEKILTFTIVLGIPSKLLGAVFGLVEAFLFVFIGLFLLSQIPSTTEFIQQGKLPDFIMTSSPVLSNMTLEYYQSFKDVLSIKDQNMNDKNAYNLESLDILLKHHIVEKETVEKLLESGKLEIKDAQSVLSKY